jgi:hypothetical protein
MTGKYAYSFECNLTTSACTEKLIDDKFLALKQEILLIRPAVCPPKKRLTILNREADRHIIKI